MDLNGKNVIYIGGFGGIGQKCTVELLRKGIKNLAIFDLNENVALMQEWRKNFSSAKILYIKMDITKKESIEAAYKNALDEIKTVDLVVNGCGLMDDRYIDLTIQINLLGVIHSTLNAIPYMDKSKGGNGGVILNISSVAGLEPTAMFAAYSAAKCGVTGFTRALGNPILYGLTGICYITVCPGLTETTLLDTPGDKSTFNLPGMVERFQSIKRQTPAQCAENIVKTVELAKNGSVWLLDLGEMKEMEFPVFWKPTLQ